AQTIFLTFAPPEGVRALADEVIAPRLGPEVLAGSTRLKAGTATKIILNALTTTAMVGVGKVYAGRMVDVQPTSANLRARALRMVRELSGLPAAEAEKLLARAGGSVKVAVVMHQRGVQAAPARALLDAAGGRLREVVGPPGEIKPPPKHGGR